MPPLLMYAVMFSRAQIFYVDTRISVIISTVNMQDNFRQKLE